MRHSLRLAGLAVAVLLLSSSTVRADDDAACRATPALAPSYAYEPGAPVVLIGAGDATTSLTVDRLPTDRYATVTVASDSDGPFAFTLTPPEGAARAIFTTDRPDSLTGALLLDQRGAYTITVTAPGSWAVVIR